MRHALIALVLLLAAPGFAQHPGGRPQWQPQTEQDARLQQCVEAELICISTQRGLPLLAEKSGVSLSVAPENLDTVGERKFTVIAKGCTLKEIMVQLCQALRECHWDVDASGAQPAYLLHRNAGVEAAEQERQEAVRADTAVQRREERTARIEAARRALAMTLEEVAELEKTDPLLARALRYPPTRGAMEAFLSLPQEQIQEFAETGGLRIQYSQFPPKAQQLLLASVRAEIAWVIEYIEGEGAGPGDQEVKEQFEEFARGLPQSLEQARIGAFYSVALGLVFFADPVSVVALPPRYPRPFNELALRLLEGTGDTKEAAAQTLTQQWERRERQRREEEEQRLRARALAPEVERMLSAPIDRLLTLCALEKAAAEQTGFSVVADAFWDDGFRIPVDKAGAPTSVRQALDAAAMWAVLEWWTTGRVLVIRRRDFDWYNHARRDVPESAVFRYRDKLRAQGHFTLDDAVALADGMSRRGGVTRGGGASLPEDLQTTGLGDLAHPADAWAVALLRSLTPEQRAQAERAEGVRLADLSQEQRDTVTRYVDRRLGRVADGPATVFRIVQSEGIEEGRHYTHCDLRLQWGERGDEEVTVWVRLFEGPPTASADGRG